MSVLLYRPESPRCQGSDCGSCGHRASYHERPGGSCLVIMPGALDALGHFPECPCADYFPCNDKHDPGCGLPDCLRAGKHVPACPLWRRAVQK